MSVHGSDDPNIPAGPIPDPGGVRDGRGTPVDSRTPPPVARTGSQFKTSNLRLVVLGLVVFVLVVAILVGSRGVDRIGSKVLDRVAPGPRHAPPRPYPRPGGP